MRRSTVIGRVTCGTRRRVGLANTSEFRLPGVPNTLRAADLTFDMRQQGLLTKTVVEDVRSPRVIDSDEYVAFTPRGT